MRKPKKGDYILIEDLTEEIVEKLKGGQTDGYGRWDNRGYWEALDFNGTDWRWSTVVGDYANRCKPEDFLGNLEEDDTELTLDMIEYGDIVSVKGDSGVVAPMGKEIVVYYNHERWVVLEKLIEAGAVTKVVRPVDTSNHILTSILLWQKPEVKELTMT